MTTATALRHVENALRSRLGVRAPHARRIVERRPIVSPLDCLAHDVRGCIAIVGDLGGGSRGVNLYVPDADGTLRWFADLDLLPEDLVRFDAMPIERAYAIPDGMHLPATDVAIGADDDGGFLVELLDSDPEDALPAMPDAHQWRDGVVLSHEISGGHVRVVAEIDGERTVHAMIPLFGTAQDLSAYVAEQVGLQARLCVLAPSPFRLGIGVPADMPIIDMIIPDRDRHAVATAFAPRLAA